jgi:hypothetical protein
MRVNAKCAHQVRPPPSRNQGCSAIRKLLAASFKSRRSTDRVNMGRERMTGRSDG